MKIGLEINIGQSIVEEGMNNRRNRIKMKEAAIRILLNSLKRHLYKHKIEGFAHIQQQNTLS